MKFYMLCGLPGVGKSTWIHGLESELRNEHYPLNDTDIVVISTDDIIEGLGVGYGMTYNELFDPVTYSFAEKMMYKIAKHYIDKKTKFVIWDQTNLTVKSRKRKIDMIPAEYHMICVYFEVPADHQARLDNRAEKHIPPHVIESMKKSLEIPTESEGFSEVIKILT